MEVGFTLAGSPCRPNMFAKQAIIEYQSTMITYTVRDVIIN